VWRSTVSLYFKSDLSSSLVSCIYHIPVCNDQAMNNSASSTPKRISVAKLRPRNRRCCRVFPLPVSSKRVRAGLRLLPIIVLLSLFAVAIYGGIPASYRDVRRKERALPQHRWEVACPWGRMSMKRRCYEGVPDKDGRYFLRFPDHLWGHGFNNALQEA